MITRRLPQILTGILALGFVLPATAAAGSSWQEELDRMMPLLGHRNWIAVVDSAYPLQNSTGITVIASQADALEVIRHVLGVVRASQHVRPHVYLDAELPHLRDVDAPGISAYREALKQLLQNEPQTLLAHERIIKRLGDASTSFRILVIKTTLALPYTSVFLELQCGYWTDQAEANLRREMGSQ